MPDVLNDALCARISELTSRVKARAQRVLEDGEELADDVPCLGALLVLEGVLSVYKDFGEVWDAQRERLEELFVA
jgi:hypothetical protein